MSDLPLPASHQSKPFFAVSDVHLGAVPPATESAFLEFLSFAAAEGQGLLINGDLFDVWFAPDEFVPQRYLRVLARLAEIIGQGLPVYFVAGNRDAAEWGGNVLQNDLGITVLPDPARLEMAGRHVLVAHGDGVDASAARLYRKPNAVLRYSWILWAARHLLPASWLFRKLAANS